LRRRCPELAFDVHCDTRQVDLARREADIAIRGGRSSSPVVVDRLVGRLQIGLYAAPAYVERRLGEPTVRPADLARHDFVGFDREWEHVPQHRWLAALGARRFAFRSNSDEAIGEAIVQGFGIGPLTSAQARTMPVVRIDVDDEGPSLPLYLSFHRDLRRVPRVRRVLDALSEGIRQAL
jgi:DNA-binding transcriptional LysR family regulator